RRTRTDHRRHPRRSGHRLAGSAVRPVFAPSAARLTDRGTSLRCVIRLRRIGPVQFTNVLETVLGIYTAAMHPPSEQLTGRMSIMRNHAAYPDFACLLAEAPQERRIVGFAYGFHGTEGQ